jgi:hypothetical protein
MLRSKKFTSPKGFAVVFNLAAKLFALPLYIIPFWRILSTVGQKEWFFFLLTKKQVGR